MNVTCGISPDSGSITDSLWSVGASPDNQSIIGKTFCSIATDRPTRVVNQHRFDANEEGMDLPDREVVDGGHLVVASEANHGQGLAGGEEDVLADLEIILSRAGGGRLDGDRPGLAVGRDLTARNPAPWLC
jgi:hypothetical protein